MIKNLKTIFLLAIIFTSLSCKKVIQTDLLLINANVITVDDKNTIANTVAVRDGKIIGIFQKGFNIDSYITKNTLIIDLKNKTLIPGFIEGHGHFVRMGATLKQIDLKESKSWDEVINVVEKAIKTAKKGEWIIGRGWHQEKWRHNSNNNVQGFPHHLELSKISSQNPVLLTHASGHAVFANKKAMDLANISSKTKDVAGGDIIRDNLGVPIGVFTETAMALVRRPYFDYRSQFNAHQKLSELKDNIIRASNHAASYGVTSFQSANSSFSEIDAIKKLIVQNKLKTRLWMMLSENDESINKNYEAYKNLKHDSNNMLNIGGIKRFIDGALGSRGAWMLAPYSDAQNTSGQNVSSMEKLENSARIALKYNLQLCTHAIGDRGNREVLNTYEKFYNQSQNKDLRWRIEHAQLINESDIPRFKEIGVLASMQGNHCTSDAPYVEKRIGKIRAKKTAYVWRSLIESGAKINNGTDVPVEHIDPIKNYYSTVTREYEKGKRFYENQKMSRIEALKSYTINNAYATFEEDIKGSIEIGKLADFTVLSQDITTVPEKDILNTKVLYTILGGKIVYSQE